MAESVEKQRRRRIRQMVNTHPDEVLAALLEVPFWPEGLDAKESYQRFGDDDNSFLRVLFSDDGDAWPNMFHLEMEGDREHMATSPRYRTYFGGGHSLRTRAALLMLAKAIAMDNADHPQERAQK